MYSLPWGLWILPFIFKPSSLNGIKNSFKNFYLNTHSQNLDPDQNDEKSRFDLFMCCGFLVFLILWTIPNQRSHHYALPALPFFLYFLAPLCFRSNSRSARYFLLGLLGLIGLLCVLAQLLVGHGSSVWFFLSLGLFFVSFVFLLISKFRFSNLAVGYTLCFSIFWSVMIPTFALPKLPGTIASKYQQNPIHTVFKKNYYYEQLLGAKVTVLDFHRVRDHMDQSGGLYIFTQNFLSERSLLQRVEVLEKWDVWKGKIKTKALVDALKKRDPSGLKEKYLLVRARPLQ